MYRLEDYYMPDKKRVNHGLNQLMEF